MLADKDITNTLIALADHIDYWYLADLDVARGATAEQLSQCLDFNKPHSIFKFSSPRLAVQQACKRVKKSDRVLVFGSFHTVNLILKDLSEFSYISEDILYLNK